MFRFADSDYALRIAAEPSLAVLDALKRKHNKKALALAGRVRTAIYLGLPVNEPRVSRAVWLDSMPPAEFPKELIGTAADIVDDSVFCFFHVKDEDATRSIGQQLERRCLDVQTGKRPVLGVWMSNRALSLTLCPNWDVRYTSILRGERET